MDNFLTRRRTPAGVVPVASTSSRQSTVWDHVTVTSRPGQPKLVRCNYCTKDNWNATANRLQAHLGHRPSSGVVACPGVPDRVKEQFQLSESAAVGQQTSLTSLVRPAVTKAADDAVADCFFFNSLAFNVANSLAWDEMIEAVARAGPGYKSPSAYRLRTTLLERSHARVVAAIKPIMTQGARTGCSLASDGWTDTAGHPLVNIMWGSPDSCIFLSSHSAEGEVKDATWLAKVLGERIEELGPENVVLVVTDNASVCVAAGKQLEEKYPHIMWVGCLAHCLDLLIKDICKLPWAAAAVSLCRSIVKFIKKHDKTRHLFLVHSSIQLLLLGDTRFATAISTLERLIKVKAALVLTVKDPEWTKFKKRLPKERRDKAKRFEAAVLGKSEEGKLMWSDAAVLVGVCHPILTVLRMADGQAPCTGEVYHFMYTLQEHISEADMGGGSLAQQQGRRSTLQELLGSRWDFLHQPIYAAAYALNPQFWDQGLETVEEVMQGLRDVLEKLLGPDLVNVALQEWQDFRARRGAFGGAAAAAGARSMLPYRFWDVYRTGCKTLRPIAVRLLAQCASASPCERNWSAYEFVHSRKRNRLGALKAQQLVYVFQNLRVLMKHSSHEKADEYYQWAMHTKVEPDADDLSDSDGDDSSVEADSDDE